MPVITYSSTYSPNAATNAFRSSSLLSGTGSGSNSSSHKYLDNFRTYPNSSSSSSASIASNTSASSTFFSSSSSSSLSSASSATSTYGLGTNSLSSGHRSLVRPTLRGLSTGTSIGSTPRSSISSYTNLHSSPASNYVYSSPLAGL